jgi:effector-binding domain-containing protein
MNIKEAPAQRVISRRLHTTYRELGATMHDSLKEIADWIEPRGSWPAGPPFAIYYNQPFTLTDVDVEIGVPVARGVPDPEGPNAPHIRELPAARVACTTYVGPYAGIGAAYEELYEWIVLQGYQPAGAPRERYVVGPDQTSSPGEYCTEIEVPVA